MKRFFIIFFFFLSALFQMDAQEKITGFITDSHSGEPLVGAVVYFNATSLGVVTNNEGYFEIKKPEGLVSPLVISFLGYEKIILEEPFSEDVFKIKMLPALNWLDAVILEGDARIAEKKREEKRKEKHTSTALDQQESEWFFIFKNLFLGRGAATKNTHIKNVEVFEFKYDSDAKIVYVSAKGPIIIENEYLEYRISYNLDFFSFNQVWNGQSFVPDSYSIAGTSFFTDLLDPEDIGRRKYRKAMERREKAFDGSSLHFMRFLARNQLSAAGFNVYTLEGFLNRVPANFSLIENEKYTEVFPPSRFYVEHDGEHTAIFAKRASFKIDKYGNFYPWNALRFDGFMGNAGMSSAVPRNYKIQK